MGSGKQKDTDAIVQKLNEILEFEISGVTRYLHYSFMMFGASRIPITGWLRGHATDGMNHATQCGEWITALGGHPTVKVRPTPEGHKHDVKTMLTEALTFEREGMAKYVELFELARDQNIALEDWARKIMGEEQAHIYEMDKMLRT
ncbi:MAG: bacterioferritin [Deltaproteobacteria bacterium]|nr:bacterioferritin [Deltaproteobacteria bacterium]